MKTKTTITIEIRHTDTVNDLRALLATLPGEAKFLNSTDALKVTLLETATDKCRSMGGCIHRRDRHVKPDMSCGICSCTHFK